MLGRFVELALPCISPIESMQFYSRLGFRLAPDTGQDDIRHVVMGDGRLAIGLRAQGIKRPTLVFVREDLQHHLDRLNQAGVSIDAATIGEAAFNRLEGLLPNGIGLSLMEALTHSPQSFTPTPLGWFAEISVCRSNVDMAGWQALGLIAHDQTDDTPPRVAIVNDTLNLGLYSRPEFGDFWLSFESDDLRACSEALERLGIEYRRTETLAGIASLVATAPEGTPLVVYKSS